MPTSDREREQESERAAWCGIVLFAGAMTPCHTERSLKESTEEYAFLLEQLKINRTIWKKIFFKDPIESFA